MAVLWLALSQTGACLDNVRDTCHNQLGPRHGHVALRDHTHCRRLSFCSSTVTDLYCLGRYMRGWRPEMRAPTLRVPLIFLSLVSCHQLATYFLSTRLPVRNPSQRQCILQLFFSVCYRLLQELGGCPDTLVSNCIFDRLGPVVSPLFQPSSIPVCGDSTSLRRISITIIALLHL